MIELNFEKAQIFLQQNNFFDCEIKKIAGDASFRSYYRIFHQKSDVNYILMFAPPSHEDIHPFIKIDQFLFAYNFSAPKIFAIDEKEGFILLEDFGDDSYGRVLKALDSNLEEIELDLYKKACDCLSELHKIAPPQDLECYNHALLFREVMLFVDWYLKYIKKVELNLHQRAQYKRMWFDLFDMLNRDNQILVLRDYHADNLMLVKDRAGYKSVGLLDFQDAVVGSRAYDLVSLLEDARREVSQINRQKLLDHYLSHSQLDNKNFMVDYEILSLQRNIKIIGIFARLAYRDSKLHYLDMLPRVINYVKIRLKSRNTAFDEISEFIEQFI